MTRKTKSQSALPRSEKWLSFAILSVLGLIAFGIWTVQSDFNTAIVQMFSEQAVSDQATVPPQFPETVLPLPEDMSALTAPETFDAKTLSDKINGKAELYLSAGFKELQSQRFAVDSSPERWFEIFIFDMDTPENAFAVYSSQKREDAIPLDLGRYAYGTANAFFWIHGAYYLELIATDDSENARTRMEQIAESFNRTTTADVSTVTESELFPAQGLDQDSITLIPSDGFGLQNFDNVLVAEYNFEDERLSAYISNRGSSEAAEQMAENFRQFLVAFGGNELETEEYIVIEILETYEVIFTFGPYMAGVHEAANQKQALSLAQSIRNQLEETIGR